MQSISLKLSGLILVISLFISCGITKHHEKNDFIKPSEVAFIEFFQTQEGEVMEGKTPRGRRIDGPTYRYDNETRKLKILRKDILSLDSAIVILGNGKILKGASGEGLSMRLSVINRLPFTMNNLTLIKVDDKGIHLSIDSKELLLKEGESWQTSKVSIDTLKQESLSIVKTTTTYSIRYFGKLGKDGVAL